MSRTLNRNRLRELLPTQWNDLDSLVEHWFGPQAMTRQLGNFAPASLWEDKEGYFVEVDVPGVARDAVELTFEKGTLRIVADRIAPTEERTALIDERRYGKVARSVTLPETVDPESIAAELCDGVLRVRIAKKPEAQPRRIEVKVS